LSDAKNFPSVFISFFFTNKATLQVFRFEFCQIKGELGKLGVLL